MDIPALEIVGKAIVTLLVFILAWQVLKVVLKSTVRLLNFGCMAVIGIAGIAWLMGWLG
jgi:hypothetical protein